MNYSLRKLIVAGLLCVHFGGYTLESAPVVTVPKGETILNTDTGHKQQLFQLLDRPGSPLPRMGVLSENMKDRKRLAVATQLHIPNSIDVGTSEAYQLDLRSAFDLAPATAPEQRYAVGILGDAQWAASEHDDTPGSLHIRSLPSPWLIKSSRGEMKANLVFPASPGNKDFLVILFSPGRDPVCHIAQCRANVVAGRIGDRNSGPFTVALVSPCNSLFAGTGPFTVEALLQRIKGMTGAPYLYRVNEESWYDEYSALFIVLLCRSTQPLTVSNADALLRAYITLGLQNQISPEWIHRVWLLFLSISPYEADEFRALIRCENVNDIVQFMQGHIGDILERHRGPVMNPDVVRAIVDRQQQELRQWRGRTFILEMRDILQKKDARPDLRNCYGAYPIDAFQEEALDTANYLFEQDMVITGRDSQGRLIVTPVPTPSHVNWPRCLWKRTPVVTAAMSLEEYFPKPGWSEDQVKRKIGQDWVQTGNPGQKLFSCTTDPHVANQELQRLNSWGLNLNEKEGRTCFRILDKFPAQHPGLKLMYALGRFLNAARSAPGNLKFQAIQLATGARNFSEFLRSGQWPVFVAQVFDNSIAESRCGDGVRQALEACLDTIIQPEQPRDIPVWYLWCERQVNDYCKRFLCMFDFHFEEDHEEGTYGGINLRHKVNPIFGFSPYASGFFLSGRYREGRNPVTDVLMPLKTGEFGAFSAGGFFYNRWHKKNASNRRLGDYRFVHIAPFSPVTILYRSIRNLFQKRFTGGEENSLSHEEQEAFNVFLRLLLSISDIHHEYVAFIAPVLDTTVSDEQNDLWNVNENGLEPSLFAIKRNSVVNLVGDGKHALFNQRLKFWKIDDDSNYFYPSFEACKHLAVALGYAQWEKNERATDLATLRLQDGFPNWDPNRDHPADKNPPAQTELYGLQFLRWQAVPSYFQGPFGRESYYIDTRQVLRYANINVWGEHIDGEGAPRQVPAPDMFKRYFVPDQIAKHADPIQKALYTAVYPDGPAHVRTIYQIRGELIRAKNDLRQWDDLEQRQRQGDLPNDDISSLMALLGKYPDGKDAIERTIHNLTTELAETGV